MQITIRNWEKFNPRKDVAKCSWFRLSHDLFENPDFFEFSHTDLVVWLYLLSLASKKSAGSISVNVGHAERIGRIKRRDFIGGIKKLQGNQCITVDAETERERDADVTRAGTTNERTNVTNKTDGQTNSDSPPLDFQSAWKPYPRKVNRSEAEKRFRQVIHSPEEQSALLIAIDRYSANCVRLKTEERFILHMSTFLENRESKPYVQPWRDWLDPESGTVTKPAVPVPEWRRKALEDERRMKNGA